MICCSSERQTVSKSRKALAVTLQMLGRLVVGPRRPWETSVRDFEVKCEDPLLASLRLARKRQHAGLEGRRAQACALLRSELDGLPLGNMSRLPRLSVEALLSRGEVPKESVRVLGVARPLQGGRWGVGDPGSGDAVEAVGLRTRIPRGSAVELAGKWDAQHRCLNDVTFVKAQFLSDRTPQTLAGGLPEESDSKIHKCNSPEKRQSKAAAVRAQEGALLPKAIDALETANLRSQLSLSALCRINELLVDAPAGIGGNLRNGPAVVRLDGLTTFFPPPVAAARSGAEVFTATLAEHLHTADGEVPPAVLAAESVARFTDLHPFADGNGRVARAIATWLLVRAGYHPRNNETLGGFFHSYLTEHYWTLRHHQLDPWSWHQFFFDAVLMCFVPPKLV
jgi:fido (protein-threonine AMPylation protein)